MNANKSEPSRWREEDVEAMLFDFFDAEMPVELKKQTALPTTTQPTTTGAARNPSIGATAIPQRTGRLSLSVVAAALCLTVGLIVTSSPTGPGTDAPSPSNAVMVSPENAVTVRVADVTASAPVGGIRVVSDALPPGSPLDPRCTWHPAVIPVEMRKFAAGLLIHSGDLDPAGHRKGDIEIKGDIEVPGFGFDDDEEETIPKKR